MSLALCIKKEDVIKSQYPDYVKHVCIAHDTLINSYTYLLKRDFCETKPEYLQLIPYVTLRCKKTNKVFLYTRGKSSKESRLQGMCSIGLGGHIEETVDSNLYHTLATNALRELNEEIGLTYNDSNFNLILDKLNKHDYICYHQWSDDVGKVHLAIMFTLIVNSEKLINHEKDIIERGTWLNINEIKELISNGNIELEKWSQFVLSMLDDVFE